MEISSASSASQALAMQQVQRVQDPEEVKPGSKKEEREATREGATASAVAGSVNMKGEQLGQVLNVSA